MLIITRQTKNIQKVTVTRTHPAFSLAYLDSLFAEAQAAYPTLERDECAVVGDGELAGVGIEFFVQEKSNG